MGRRQRTAWAAGAMALALGAGTPAAAELHSPGGWVPGAGGDPSVSLAAPVVVAQGEARQQERAPRLTVGGTITEVRAHSLRVKTDAGSELQLRADERTRIIGPDGEAANLTALREGDQVRASYEQGSGVHPNAVIVQVVGDEAETRMDRGEERSTEVSPGGTGPGASGGATGRPGSWMSSPRSSDTRTEGDFDRPDADAENQEERNR